MEFTSEETDYQTIDTYDRLEIFKETQGFYPATYRELSEAFVLPSYSVKRGGTAKHLNEILLHQQKAQTDDPRRAVIRVTQEYATYFKTARLSLTHLILLSRDVNDTDNPNLSLEVASGTNIGFGDLVRFLDLRQLAREKVVPKDEIDPLSTDYLHKPTPLVATHIDETIKRLHIKETRSIMSLAINDQHKRALFWKERLVESQRHELARPIASAALRR